MPPRGRAPRHGPPWEVAFFQRAGRAGRLGVRAGVPCCECPAAAPWVAWTAGATVEEEKGEEEEEEVIMERAGRVRPLLSCG